MVVVGEAMAAVITEVGTVETMEAGMEGMVVEMAAAIMEAGVVGTITDMAEAAMEDRADIMVAGRMAATTATEEAVMSRW